MEIKHIGNIVGGQDGAIYGSELFRFDDLGNCWVYNLDTIDYNNATKLALKSQFKLGNIDKIVPHSNAVCFGSEFYSKEDKYPLLYCNVYNNYMSCENRRFGVCLVYRLQNVENEYKATLVQMIEIDFCEDETLWKATKEKHGVRPYGNFVVDIDTNSYWAFVMRNKDLGTRYFKFNLPKVSQGVYDETVGVNKVVLSKNDIIESFDLGFIHYMQGAILKDSKIYSTEGFCNNETERPAIRIIDLKTKTEVYYDILSNGYKEEPEFIDFYKDDCLYSDADGNLYKIEF